MSKKDQPSGVVVEETKEIGRVMIGGKITDTIIRTVTTKYPDGRQDVNIFVPPTILKNKE